MASAKSGDSGPELRILISFFFGLFTPVQSCLQQLNTKANKWTLKSVNTKPRRKWLPLKKRKCLSVTTSLTLWSHLSYQTIHDSDVERVVFKLCWPEKLPDSSLFVAKLWAGFSWWISTKARHKGTRADAYWLDICWATHCLWRSSLMLNGCWFVWLETSRVLFVLKALNLWMNSRLLLPILR